MTSPMSRAAAERHERRRRHEDARGAERTFLDTLEAKTGDTGYKIKPPPARERRAARFGGGTRDRTHGSYDWFYELHPDEQKRIRARWFSDRGAAPDEVEHAGLPMSEWLTLSRGVDAARAVQRGRELQARRYGGSHPLKFLARGRPEDHGRRVSTFKSRTGRDHEVDRSDHVQFFTDAEGRVHPIRASEPSYRPHKSSRTFTNSYGERVDWKPSYDPDEAF